MQLPPREEEMWQAYLQAENAGDRDAALLSLQAFLRAIDEISRETRDEWARDVSRRVIDDGRQILVRVPLFERVIFPVLLTGLENGSPDSARWLAGFSQTLYRAPHCRSLLPESANTEEGLLRLALQHDPHDRRARNRLSAAMSRYLKDTLHELPAGVLYGQDGATAEQCLKLQTEVDELVQLLGPQRPAELQTLIDDCRFHYREYRNYLLSGEQFDSYDAYLKAASESDGPAGGRSSC